VVVRPERRRNRAGIVALRLLSAAIALAALGALVADLASKSSSPPRALPEEASPPPREERRGDEKPAPVRDGDPTVYDTQAVLERCTRAGRRLGPSSTGPGFDDDVRRISTRVERIRRLSFRRPVETRLVSRAEVGARYLRGLLRRYGEREAARDARVLAALRLVPEGTDLRAVAVRLLAGGVGGFYTPRTGRLFAAASGAELTPYDEVVLAHELDHALVDQVLRLPGTLSRDPMLADVMLARQALGEGDATLVMSRYARARFTGDAYDVFAARFSPRPVGLRAGIPYVFARTSEFPYYEGLLFACAEWRARGWGGLDRMYSRPPVSTADVLFPRRYRADHEAELPRPPGSPGAAWGPAHARSFGAFDVMVLLENADLLTRGTAVAGSHVEAVRGWNGGVLHSWLRGNDTTIHLALADAGVETPRGRSRRLCGVLRGWFHDTFPDARPAAAKVPHARAWRSGGDLALLSCRGSSVALTKGPEERAVRRVARG
jgi:hypothetical protein